MNLEEQRSAPIYEALERFRKMRVVPFDVPGHKRGRGNPDVYKRQADDCLTFIGKVEINRFIHIGCGWICNGFVIDEIKNSIIFQCLFQPFCKSQLLNAGVCDNQHASTFVFL